MNTKEIWKDVTGYEGSYQVSSLGNVKSLRRLVFNGVREHVKDGKMLNLSVRNNGYLSVGLHKLGCTKTILVHQLVAICFLNHTPDGQNIVVDHINNDKTDNSVLNLQLINQRLNSSKINKIGISGYIGSTWNCLNKKWQARARFNGRKINIGYYDCPKKASECYLYVTRMINFNSNRTHEEARCLIKKYKTEFERKIQ